MMIRWLFENSKMARAFRLFFVLSCAAAVSSVAVGAEMREAVPPGGPENAPYMVATTLFPSEEVFHVLTIDWMCEEDAENTYFCTMNWYNSSGENIVDGSGYAGFQNVNGAHKVILSLWDTAGGSPRIEYPAGYDDSFSGEGTGKHVIADYPWETGVWYTMRIQAHTKDGRTYFEQWVQPEDGNWQKTAEISFPKERLGFTWSCAFQEDFTGNNRRRSCRLKNAYANSMYTGEWVSCVDYYISNTAGNAAGEKNVMYDCDARTDGDSVRLESGGYGFETRCALQLPGNLRVTQPDLPAWQG